MSTPKAQYYCKDCGAHDNDYDSFHKGTTGHPSQCSNCSSYEIGVIKEENTPNAEDLVVEFEDKKGYKYVIYFELDVWIIEDKELYEGLYLEFDTLRDAEACAESLKKSV